MKLRALSALAVISFSTLGSLLVATPASAADAPPVRKVTVIGTAIVKIAPDEMNWSVQVSINDSTLARAKERHDASLTAALSYIKSLGDATRDLQTGGIRFDRNLFPGDDSFAKHNPFSCSTQLTFTLTDFDKYGPIADALAKLDGVQVQSVDYATSKEAELGRDALKRALLDGHDKASDLAVAANCYIDKPLSIEEQEADNVRPQMMNATFSARSSGGTPDAVAGQIEITAKVIVAYDLFYK